MLEKKHELVLTNFLSKNPNVTLLPKGLKIRTVFRRYYEIIFDCGDYVLALDPDTDKIEVLNYGELEFYELDGQYGAFPTNRMSFTFDRYTSLLEKYVTNLTNQDKVDLIIYLILFAPDLPRVSKMIETLKYDASKFNRLVEFNADYIPSFGRYNYSITCDSRFYRDHFVFNCFGKSVEVTFDFLSKHFFDIYNRVYTKTIDGSLAALSDIELAVYYRLLGYKVIYNPNIDEWSFAKAHSRSYIPVTRIELLDYNLVTAKLHNSYYAKNLSMAYSRSVFEDSFYNKSFNGDLYNNLSPLEIKQLLVIALITSCDEQRVLEGVELIKQQEFSLVSKMFSSHPTAHLFKMNIKKENDGFSATLPFAEKVVNGVYSPSYPYSITWNEFNETLSEMINAVENYSLEELTIFELCLFYKMKFAFIFPINEIEFVLADELNILPFKQFTVKKEQLYDSENLLKSIR